MTYFKIIDHGTGLYDLVTTRNIHVERIEWQVIDFDDNPYEMREIALQNGWTEYDTTH